MIQNSDPETIHFSKETDGKFSKLLELRSTLKERYMTKMSAGKKMEETDFTPTNPTTELIDNINKDLYTGKKRLVYICLYILSSIGYSVMYTRKLKKLNLPYFKSIYCWGFTIVSILSSLRYYEVKMQSDFNKQVEEFLVDHVFELQNITNEEERNKCKKLYLTEFDEYKFLKYGNKNV